MIYWDNNATTPIAEEVLEVMLPYLRGDFYRWCRDNGIKGWKVYLYSERM